MRVEVFTLEKITIDNKEIMLGMNINEVQKLIGIPDRVFSNCDGESGRHYYFDSELGLDFDESGLLEFIEFLGGIDGNLRPYLYGVSAFETSADELLKMIMEQDDEVDDSEAFERVRRWRGLATRYCERLSSLVVAVQIRCA